MGDTEARLIYSVTIALSGLLGGAIWWQAMLMIPAVFVGTTTGNFDSMSMGRGQYSYAHDLFGMSLHAILSVILPLLVVGGTVLLPIPEYHNVLWLSLYLLASPLYTVGWMIAGKQGKVIFPIGLRGGSELGEAFWGAVCALATFLCYTTIFP